MRSISAVAILSLTYAFAVAAQQPKPVQSVRRSVPAAESALDPDPNRYQIIGISVHSDGKFLIIDTEMKNKLTTRAGVALRVYVDTDNNAATGAADPSGKHKGFEYRSSVEACIDDFKGGATCSGDESKPKAYHGLAEVSRLKKGDPSPPSSSWILRDTADDIRKFYDAEQTPNDGKVVEGKIAYADIGVKPGQTIRLVACTASAFHDFTFFPDILLQLK
jgi:hypothetical protein